MFLFSLALYTLCFWFIQLYGPWLAVVIPALALGLRLPTTLLDRVRIAAAGGLSWAALAATEDMINADLVSLRLAGLFHLPQTWLIFPLFGFLISLSSFAVAQAAAQFRPPRAKLA